MTSLNQAQTLANAIEEAQTQFETYIRSTLQEYLDFLPERGSSWVTHFKDAPYFTFKELDGRNFIFESDEYYSHGEYETDHVSLPFEFVEAPETYKARILDEIKAAEAAKKARVKASQEERVAKLRAQLEAAEASLAKSQIDEDLIGTLAFAKQTGEIRAAIHRQGI